MNKKHPRAFLPSRDALGLCITLACALAYGFCWPATRAAYAHGANSAFVILAITLTRTASLLLVCLLQRKGLYKTTQARKLAATGGFWQAVSIVGSFSAMLYLPGPVAAIILFTHTLMLLFFMAWRGQITLDAAAIVTTVCALGGLVLVLDVKSGPVSLPGLAFALLSAVATMSRLYVYGQQTKSRDPMVVGAESFAVASLLLLVFVLLKFPHPPNDAAGYGWTAFLCVMNAGGTIAMFYALSLVGSFRFSLFMKLEPVFAALFSALLIRELLHWSQYLGIAVVFGSLVIYQYMSFRARK
jgi:drug/metabolite transporter (DMT)-like permease